MSGFDQKLLELGVVDRIRQGPSSDLGVEPGVDRFEPCGACDGGYLHVSERRRQQFAEFVGVSQDERRAKRVAGLCSENSIEKVDHRRVAGRCFERGPGGDGNLAISCENSGHLGDGRPPIDEEHGGELAGETVEGAVLIGDRLCHAPSPLDRMVDSSRDLQHPVVWVESHDHPVRAYPADCCPSENPRAASHIEHPISGSYLTGIEHPFRPLAE